MASNDEGFLFPDDHPHASYFAPLRADLARLFILHKADMGMAELSDVFIEAIWKGTYWSARPTRPSCPNQLTAVIHGDPGEYDIVCPLHVLQGSAVHFVTP